MGILIFSMLPQKITKELVVASLISETTRFNLDTLLEQAKLIRYDRDGLSTNYDLLLKLRGVWDFLDKRRKDEDKAEKEIIATRKAGYEEIMNPIAELLDAADPHIFALNTEILLEEKATGEAIQKQIDNRDALSEFINSTIRSIVAAPDNKELVRIQKLIGSEKGHRSKYDEYADIAGELVDELLQLIDGRKKLIAENEKLQNKFDQAVIDLDHPAQVEITKLMESGQQHLEENAAAIAADAFKKISGLPIAGYEQASQAVKPRLHRWSWRVDDIELLYKKSPEFVVKEANTKTINSFMKEKTESGELDEYKDNIFNGLVIYRKPFYVSVKTGKDAS